jgi:glycosyltransferase involved in cell wall biosynthesis
MAGAWPWRRGVAVVSYDVRPTQVTHPGFRPLLLLRDAGFEVHTVSRGPGRERFDLDGVQAWIEPGMASAARRILALRAELLFVEFSTFGTLWGELGRRSWIRNPQLARRPAVRRLQRAALGRFDAVSVTNPAAAADWRFRRGQFVDLPYPIDVPFWSTAVGRREGWWTERGWAVPAGPVLVCNAALMRVKRHPEILEAVAPFLRSEPGAVLVLVGHAFEPDVGEEVERLRRALGVADQVRLTGWIDHDAIRELLAWATVAIMNSSAETQCMAIYEAMAAGVPTLIAAIPQLTSQFPALSSHRDGAGLAANLERLVADDDLRRRQVEAGRDRLAWADQRRHDDLFFATVERLLDRSP